ncbi:HD-GYP domain-containing protein [sulfur-oxidizing endosymbiont of Gigantopelta aegis]|uniref:HD-GYP domain-containing protein n=1 Tax=sulfur-oxidizing endosymbiont of Gigantopelta aegis TaxID=2794934 RepID=UPI0018DB1B5F|nr:HD-GYP domain-containing protein [sulfur-oxidizing endosymbiont of Gigantopelta aegis]
MAVNSKKIDIKSLTQGMYISKLDRPWIYTSYPIEGFYVRDNNDIQQLSALCQHVYIDVDLTKLRVDISQLEQIGANTSKLTARTVFAKQDSYFNNAPSIEAQALQPKKQQLKRNNSLYIEKVAFEKEFKTVHKLYENITLTATEIMNQASRGKFFDIEQIKQTAGNMVDSIIRNPDAFLWLSRLKAKDTHTHNRSIRATIWAIAFGRHLSLPKKELTELSIAVLLANIGKARLPRQLLEESDEIEGAKLSVYRKHINLSVNLLKRMGGFSEKILETIAAHCERYDGTGYPRKLSQDQIIFPAQIAGLVCYYEKITNQRDSYKSLDATRAMEHLYALRNSKFQSDLVEEFIQSIGIYPAGSLIELNSREIAVIIEQNTHYKLLPKVMILRDKEKNPVSTLKILDLASIHATHDAKPKIINSIPLGSFGIDSDEIINSLQKADKSWLMKKLFT